MPANESGVNIYKFWRVMLVGILLFICIVLIPNVPKPLAPTPAPTSTSTVVFTQPVNTPFPPITNTIVNSVVVNITNTNPQVTKALVHVLPSDQTLTSGQSALLPQGCSNGQSISVWAPGYYILTFPCVDRPAGAYNAQLENINQNDNKSYAWIAASSDFKQPHSCQACHSKSLSDFLDEYPEWTTDGHSKVFGDPYFWTTYLGTDVHGNQSQQVQWNILESGQRIFPQLDPISPNFGAGYRLDYPVSNGNCAFCHVPAGSPGTLQELDVARLVNNSRGALVNVATEGITCDVCHKVTDVLIEKNSKLPYDDHPGVLSMSFVRPMQDQHTDFGPLGYQSMLGTDANTTCFPVYSESKFCAACHYGKFANTLIYGSYKEWLDSSYSRAGTAGFRSCQDCHMGGEAQAANLALSDRAACSVANRELQNFNHNMMQYETVQGSNPPRTIPKLVKDAAQIRLEPVLTSGQIQLKVTVQSVGVGHKFPTDSPLRQLILLIDARDWRNNRLVQSGGPNIPVWAVPDYGGYPGQIFANILKDKDTNLAPSFDYWNPVEAAWDGADTRLVPGVPVKSIYAFAAPYENSAKITATLIYRRAFKNVVDQKRWPIENLDALVTQVIIECTGFGADPQTITCNPVTPTSTPTP